MILLAEDQAIIAIKLPTVFGRDRFLTLPGPFATCAEAEDSLKSGELAQDGPCHALAADFPVETCHWSYSVDRMRQTAHQELESNFGNHNHETPILI